MTHAIPGETLIRPRFETVIPMPPEAVTLALQAGLSDPHCPVRGRVIHAFVTLTLPDKDRAIWSPQLTLSYGPEPDGGTRLRGVYGPAPGLWTLFMFLYTVLLTTSGILLVYGLVLRQLQLDAGVLWLVPVLLALFAGLWVAASVGQRLSRHQMATLQSFVRQCLDIDLSSSSGYLSA